MVEDNISIRDFSIQSVDLCSNIFQFRQNPMGCESSAPLIEESTAKVVPIRQKASQYPVEAVTQENQMALKEYKKYGNAHCDSIIQTLLVQNAPKKLQKSLKKLQEIEIAIKEQRKTALHRLQQAQKGLSSQNSENFYELGQICLRQCFVEKGHQYFRKALSLKPGEEKYFRSYINSKISTHEIKKIKVVIQNCENYLKQNPDDRFCLIELSIALRNYRECTKQKATKDKDWCVDNILKNLYQALQPNAQRARNANLEARVYLQIGKLQRANKDKEKGYYSNSIKKDTFYEEAYLQLAKRQLDGLTYISRKNEDEPQKVSEAKRTLENCINHVPTSWKAYKMLAEIEYYARNYKSAEKLLLKAEQISQMNYQIVIQLAFFYKFMEKIHEAKDIVLEYLYESKKVEAREVMYWLLGILEDLQGNQVEAENFYEKSLAIDDMGLAHGRMAMRKYSETQNDQQAESMIEKIQIELKPASELGVLKSFLGKYEKNNAFNHIKRHKKVKYLNETEAGELFLLKQIKLLELSSLIGKKQFEEAGFQMSMVLGQFSEDLQLFKLLEKMVLTNIDNFKATKQFYNYYLDEPQEIEQLGRQIKNALLFGFCKYSNFFMVLKKFKDALWTLWKAESMYKKYQKQLSSSSIEAKIQQTIENYQTLLLKKREETPQALSLQHLQSQFDRLCGSIEKASKIKENREGETLCSLFVYQRILRQRLHDQSNAQASESLMMNIKKNCLRYINVLSRFKQEYETDDFIVCQQNKILSIALEKVKSPQIQFEMGKANSGVEAFVHYQKALQDGLNSEKQIYLLMGKHAPNPQKSRQMIEKYYQQRPEQRNNIDLHKQIAKHFHDRFEMEEYTHNNSKEARKWLEEVFRYDNTIENSYFDLGDILYTEKEYDKAIKLYEEGVQQGFNDLNESIYSIYKQRNDTGKAIFYYTRYIEGQGEESVFYSDLFDLATLCSKGAKFEEALKYMSKACDKLQEEVKLSEEYYEDERKAKEEKQLNSQQSDEENWDEQDEEDEENYNVKDYQSGEEELANEIFTYYSHYGSLLAFFGKYEQAEQKFQRAMNVKHLCRDLENPDLAENFRTEAMEWKFKSDNNVKIDQRQKADSLLNTFTSNFKNIFKSESTSGNVELVSKMALAMQKDKVHLKELNQLGNQCFSLYQEDVEAFSCLILEFICFFNSQKKFSKQSISTIEQKIKSAVDDLCNQFPPTDGNTQEVKLKDPEAFQVSSRKINVFKTQFFKDYSDVLSEIESVTANADLIKHKLRELVQEPCLMNGGFNLLTGVKIPQKQKQSYFKVLIRVFEKMFKEMKEKREEISRRVEKQLEQNPDFNITFVIDALFRHYIAILNEVIKQKWNRKEPIECNISDFVRGKCMFDSVEQLEGAAKQIIDSCRQEKLQILQIDNRLNKGTKDLVFKIDLEMIICEFQLALKFDKVKNQFNHCLFEIKRSPTGPLFGSLLWLSKLEKISFINQVVNLSEELEKIEADPVKAVKKDKKSAPNIKLLNLTENASYESLQSACRFVLEQYELATVGRVA